MKEKGDDIFDTIDYLDLPEKQETTETNWGFAKRSGVCSDPRALSLVVNKVLETFWREPVDEEFWVIFANMLRKGSEDE